MGHLKVAELAHGPSLGVHNDAEVLVDNLEDSLPHSKCPKSLPLTGGHTLPVIEDNAKCPEKVLFKGMSTALVATNETSDFMAVRNALARQRLNRCDVLL